VAEQLLHGADVVAAFEQVRQLHVAVTVLHRLRVPRPHDIEVALQRFGDGFGQHGHAVLATLQVPRQTG
jgi:hypothetical protein